MNLREESAKMKELLTKKVVLIPLLIIILLVGIIVLPTVTGITKQTMMKKTLQWAYATKSMPLNNVLIENQKTIISKYNIGKSRIPKLDGVDFIVMEQSDIHKKANKEGDFLYLRFTKLDIGFFKCTVSLEYNWAISETSKMEYLSGGGVSMTYYNILGFWIKSYRMMTWTS